MVGLRATDRFGKETTREGCTLRTCGIVDGRRVECKADMELIIELDERAEKAGGALGKDKSAIAAGYPLARMAAPSRPAHDSRPRLTKVSKQQRGLFLRIRA